MKKIIQFLMLMIFVPTIWSACSDAKSYAELRDIEEKAINRFLADKTVRQMPTDKNVKLDSTVFYKLPTGVYVQVLETGDTTISVKNGTEVNIRYNKVRNLLTDSVRVGNNTDIEPLTLKFTQYEGKVYGIWPGIIEPLVYKQIGFMARLNILIPSKQNMQDVARAVIPYYYESVRYRYFE